MPYIAPFVGGSGLPILAACATALYGMLQLGEQHCVNFIEMVEEGEHKGKVRITVGKTMVRTYDILADPKDIMSVVSLANDDLGEEDLDQNIISIGSYLNLDTGRMVNETRIFTLPADAYRNDVFMDWLISRKDGDDSTRADF
mmetsp:Transcript_17786/g.17009  ORF Transcript_17786/g.17009 Transcript_17786/m.17009 type:complete len:143 (+) Transcript_17786:578-1006(+)